VVAAVWGVGVGVFALRLTVIERFFCSVFFFPFPLFQRTGVFFFFFFVSFFGGGFLFTSSHGVGFCF